MLGRSIIRSFAELDQLSDLGSVPRIPVATFTCSRKQSFCQVKPDMERGFSRIKEAGVGRAESGKLDQVAVRALPIISTKRYATIAF
jgi:hypothetical protein